jgi:aerobic C4-dicarboxylate transport protein
MGILRPFRVLYVQVLIGIALGVLVGLVQPRLGEQLKPLADGFIKLIKLGIAPIIFCTVASGMARMSDLKAFGRLGAKTLLYFEAVSTVALILGLAIGHFVHPGAGFNADPRAFDPTVAQGFLEKARHAPKLVDYILSLIPETFFGAFAEGQILQILVVAILTGFACTRLGPFGEKVAGLLEDGTKLFSGIIRVVVVLAPIGAFGAMAYTVGKFGLAVLAKLAALVATFYATSIVFVVVVLGLIAALAGFSIFRFIAYIREELLIVLGTSSSETVLPQIMLKLRRLGAGPTTVGLVVPAGYSFNLDGTNIYMTLATLVPGPGHQHPAHLEPGTDPAGGGHADLQGGQRRHRGGLHHPGRHPGCGPHHPHRRPGPDRRGRPVHERMPGAHQPGGQRRRRPGDRPLGRRSRPAAAGAGTGPGAGRPRRRGGGGGSGRLTGPGRKVSSAPATTPDCAWRAPRLASGFAGSRVERGGGVVMTEASLRTRGLATAVEGPCPG